jgi:putative DNA methylase
MSTSPPVGWYARGYLPHLNTAGLVQGVTFHLGDSLPAGRLRQLLAETSDGLTERRHRLQAMLDAGYGACWLRRPEIAELVERALLVRDGIRYRLLAWVVMPNHVHVLVETVPDVPLSEVVRAWKGATAREANRLLDRHGAFWERDYFDRYVRDDAHLAAAVRYIDENPVRAGLVTKPADWPFGSARRSGASAGAGAVRRLKPASEPMAPNQRHRSR